MTYLYQDKPIVRNKIYPCALVVSVCLWPETSVDFLVCCVHPLGLQVNNLCVLMLNCDLW